MNGPICEILAKNAQLLENVEKLIFFESAILNFLLHSYSKLVINYGVPRIFRNFDDYPDFQQKSRGLQNYETHCTLNEEFPEATLPMRHQIKGIFIHSPFLLQQYFHSSIGKLLKLILCFCDSSYDFESPFSSSHPVRK